MDQGRKRHNRVDGLDGATPLTKWRVIGITSESGAMLSWSYSPEQCTPTNVPGNPETNDMRCFPVYWSIDDESAPSLHWFHKYLVTEVVESDLSGASEFDVVTRYDYQGDPAWHYDESELTPKKFRTWGQYRGYEKVGTTVGEAGTVQSYSEELYFRGMDGDRAGPSGGTTNVSVIDSEGVPVADHWRYAGMTRESIVFDGPGGGEVSATIYDPWKSAVTADNGTRSAMLANVKKDRSRTKLAAGGYRRTEMTYTHDSHGLVTQTNDLGDTATSTDDLCTRIEYTKNTSAWLLDYPSRTETVSVACTVTPSRPGDVVSDSRTYYDGSSTLGAAPNKGHPTKTEDLADWDGGPVYQTTAKYAYDVHGRATSTWDALDRQTTTTYAPTTGGPVTETTRTTPDPDGTGPLTPHVTTTTLSPAWGSTVRVVDPNGKVTDAEYDALGRPTGVWLPGRDYGTESASMQYEYTVRAAGPNAVTTRSLNAHGEYVASIGIFDGLLRPRQTQALAPVQFGETYPGRTVSDTTYDSRGEVAAERGPAYDATSQPTTSIFDVVDGQMPSQTRFEYDGAGRQTAAIFLEHTTELWRTTTTYGGDRESVDPPAGGTPSTTISNARGRTTELWEYHGSAPSGSHDTTAYTHMPAGELETVTDAAGNEWSYTYDLLGRQVTSDDPDSGVTTTVYDAAGQIVSTSDARGVTLAYTYDQLGRKTSLRDDIPTGAKRAEWLYDVFTDSSGSQQVAQGQQTKSIRWSGGQAYTSEIVGYDERYRPTWTKLTVPSTEGALAGTYQTIHTYNEDGSPATSVLQGKGGLNTETLEYDYDEIGMPLSLTGSGTYVADTIYSPFGEPLQYSLGNTFGKEIWSTFTYDDATRRLESAQLDRAVATTTDSLVTYDYDSIGNFTQVTDTPETGTPDTQCFDYDYQRRLVKAWTPAIDECTSAPAVANLGGPAPYWHSWTFEAIGNRLSQTTHDTAGDTTSTYTYPAAGGARPHAVTDIATTGPGGGPDGVYTYDASGNTTARPFEADAQTLAWDAEGHLASVSDPSGVLAEYVYDADGNRLLRRDDVAGSTTLYWGGHTEVTRTSTSTVTALRYYSFNGTAVAVRDGKFASDITTMISDHHGTGTYAVANTTGALSIRRFDPYGNPRSTTGTWVGDHGFINGPTDTGIGLTHLGAREYDPVTGVFLSVDPLIDHNEPQRMHGYAYAGNNPLAFADPSGLAFTECDGRCNTGGGYGRKAVPQPGGGVKIHGKQPTNFKPDPPVKDDTSESSNERRGGRGSFADTTKNDNDRPWWGDALHCVGHAGDCAEDVGESIDDAWDATYEVALKPVGEFVVEHRGTIVSGLATAFCFVPGVGWVSCGAVQGIALGVRSQQRASEAGSWAPPWKPISPTVRSRL